MTHNYYKILGVHRGSSLMDRKQAYRAKARECHPDLGGDKDEFALLGEALVTLTRAYTLDAYMRGLIRDYPQCKQCRGEGFTAVQISFTDRRNDTCESCEGCGVIISK